MANNSPNSPSLSYTLFRTAIAIILLAAAAWGNWVTSTVTSYSQEIAKITERLARIEQKLDDHFRSDNAQRHDP